jgi:deoxyribodipyrimidine photo-lyase
LTTTTYHEEWAAVLASTPDYLEESPEPSANDESIKEHPVYGKIFEQVVPENVKGFECKDRETMMKVWPEGTENALRVRSCLFHSQVGAMPDVVSWIAGVR